MLRNKYGRAIKQQREWGRSQDKRIHDPDEHTIYDILCPQIRASWSKEETHLREDHTKRMVSTFVKMFSR